MTRKDFELIASVLHECLRKSRNSVDQSNIEYVIDEMSVKLWAVHPRFDRKRFEAACKGSE